MAGSDCLTLCVLGVCLAKRKGIEAQIAIPRRITRALHAVIVYPSEGRNRVFNIAGNGQYINPRQIAEREIRLRLMVTKPFVNLANRLKAQSLKPK